MNDWQPPDPRRVLLVAQEKPGAARRRHFRGGALLLGIAVAVQFLLWLSGQLAPALWSGPLLGLLLPLALASVALGLLGLFRLVRGLVNR